MRNLARAMRKARKEREARNADLLMVGTVLDALAFDLGEAHEYERAGGHSGDDAAGYVCSYCTDLRKVKKARAALARIGKWFIAPTGREGG